MGGSLAVVSIKAVESDTQRTADRIGSTKSPFSEAAGNVTAFFQFTDQRDGAFRERTLSFRLNLRIVPNGTMAGVHTGHQNGTGRSTDITARIVPRESDALFGQSVHGRRFDFLLSITTEVADAEIVRQNEHDVGNRSRQRTGKNDRCRNDDQKKKNESCHGNKGERVREIQSLASLPLFHF